MTAEKHCEECHRYSKKYGWVNFAEACCCAELARIIDKKEAAGGEF